MASNTVFSALESVSYDIGWAKLSRDIRRHEDLSQEELAAKLGIHSSTVSKTELEKTKPHRKTRKKYKELAQKISIPIERYKV